MYVESFMKEISAVSEYDPETHQDLAMSRCFREMHKEFANLALCRQRVQKKMENAIRQLQKLQKERKAEEQAQMEVAIKLQKLHKMQRIPFDPQEHEFVFSISEIERAAARRDLLADAEVAPRVDYNRAKFLAYRKERPLNPSEEVGE